MRFPLFSFCLYVVLIAIVTLFTNWSYYRCVIWHNEHIISVIPLSISSKNSMHIKFKHKYCWTWQITSRHEGLPCQVSIILNQTPLLKRWKFNEHNLRNCLIGWTNLPLVTLLVGVVSLREEEYKSCMLCVQKNRVISLKKKLNPLMPN